MPLRDGTGGAERAPGGTGETPGGSLGVPEPLPGPPGPARTGSELVADTTACTGISGIAPAAAAAAARKRLPRRAEATGGARGATLYAGGPPRSMITGPPRYTTHAHATRK